MNRIIPTLVIAGLLCTNALAADISPAVVYDKAGKNDKSFNEAVFNGIKRFTKDTGIAVGFSMANAVTTAAKEFPETKFTIIDMVVDLPNVQSVVFTEHEGSFLVGALAAMKSETAKVGFIGGMDIPLIRRFECGFEQGAKYQNGAAEVMSNMIGSTGAAFNNPSKGGEPS